MSQTQIILTQINKIYLHDSTIESLLLSLQRDEIRMKVQKEVEKKKKLQEIITKDKKTFECQIKSLLDWTKALVNNYPGVNVTALTKCYILLVAFEAFYASKFFERYKKVLYL